MKIFVLLLLFPLSAMAQVVEMRRINDEGVGEPIGTITVTEKQGGALFTPSLRELPPGVHGFHVHERPSCEPGEKEGRKQAGLAAGGHFDPASTGKHQGPHAEGHLGDLPALEVDAQGRANQPVLAPRIKPDDLRGRSLMIHAGGDNYADKPAPLGGGGARIACGSVP